MDGDACFLDEEKPARSGLMVILFAPSPGKDDFIGSSLRGPGGGFKGTETLFRLPSSPAQGPSACRMQERKNERKKIERKIKK